MRNAQHSSMNTSTCIIQWQCSVSQWWRDLFRCRIDLLNFSMGFSIVAPYMEFLHLNWYIAEWSWEQKTTGMKESSPQLLFQHSLPQSNRQLLQEIGKRSIVIHSVNSIRSVKFSVARRNAMIWRATSGVGGYGGTLTGGELCVCDPPICGYYWILKNII